MICDRSGGDLRHVEGQLLREATDAFFRPGGLLQQACETGGDFAYEPRPQQREMALAVAEAMAEGRHLVAEAGTGVGKSFAYLVPAILAWRETGKPVVVSTYTISLQEQLIYKDIPFLQRHLGIPFRAALVKGRQNYLCRRRLARARSLAKDLFDAGEARELARIWEWAQETTEGSLQDLPRQPSAHVWAQVCAEMDNCLGQKCREARRCFFMRARREAWEASLLVANHHLFFADLSLRAEGAGFLPRHEIVVLDEAHQIEHTASEHFGLRLSYESFEYLIRRLYNPQTAKGIFGVLRDGKAANEVVRLQGAVEKFFEAIHAWAGFTPEITQRVVPRPLGLATEVPALLRRLARALAGWRDSERDEHLCAEAGSLSNQCLNLARALEAFLGQTLEDHVYWVEREGRRRLQTVLYAAPVEVGPVLRRALFEVVPCVVMTSATLAVDGRLDYFRSRVGVDECATLAVGSPFDYARQMKVLVASNLPSPDNAEEFLPAAAQAVARLVTASRGRAFVLFTNASWMRRVADALERPLAEAGLTLLVQGSGLSRHAMLEKFRREPGCVLFGLDSFWMGVDVPGEALSLVVITRLPFAVPEEPLVKARMDRLCERGGDPFRDFSLPEAILKFRQGVGRLIRTATDTGVVAVLDGRLVRKWYGRMFLASLPECPVEEVAL